MGSCPKYRREKAHTGSTLIHEVVLPKEQYPKQVYKFLFLLKQRNSTAYNEKLESTYVKAHYISKKERYKKVVESRGGRSEDRLATAPRPYSSPVLLHAHGSGSKRNPT